ncbi:Hypothetical protein PHPALM_14638 [Phytophthora palmivora]|uniref:PiggyBac transposable element-derived protein domain-containing protein n=1 Tax=Phytophthora palmivora TaxID=4796 RepID=A0A2P4XU77_9STRA|nr:Hypothetical protein PHPALM_14638 [Phytophthora palmivora]
MVVGAYQRLLSGAESNNSDNVGGSDDASANGGGRVEDDSQVAVPTDDVNVMVDGELSDEYEAIDSSGSDISDNSGDDMIERREYLDDVPALDEEVVHMDDAFVEGMGGTLTLAAIDKDALRRFEWSTPSSSFEPVSGEYPGLSSDVAAPTRELQELADSPMLLLFYFLPKSLWVSITKETNRYKKQTANARAKRIRSLQRKRGTATPETIKQIERRLRAEPAYQPHEVLHVIGLLVARMLNPMTRRFSGHWAMAANGAIPAGNFGKFMPRNLCTSILRDLHVVNNEAPRIRDKIWKIRPVVEVLQSQFRSGWTLGSKFSFDEGVLPATSKRNTTRMFMPDKPHRYGTKLFMVCDSGSAYCHRFEVYVGKRDSGDSVKQAFDNKTGAAAVVRNMKALLGERSQGFRLVVIDRFYSSVPLAIQLLSMRIYVLGTIMVNRLGFDKQVVESRKSRPRAVERGSFAFSRSVAVPTVVACHWWDRIPVHYLATGPIMAEDSIHRNIKMTAANDEERGLFGDFAKGDLKKMLKSESFKLEMFKKWDAHTVGHIREKLGVDPLNTRWESLLFDYLNVYKKAGDEVVRHANNAKKAQARIYRNSGA